VIGKSHTVKSVGNFAEVNKCYLKKSEEIMQDTLLVNLLTFITVIDFKITDFLNVDFIDCI